MAGAVPRRWLSNLAVGDLLAIDSAEHFANRSSPPDVGIRIMRCDGARKSLHRSGHRCGMKSAVRDLMARDFRQLVVWQLADELQTIILELTRTERWARDFGLRDEALKTTSQMCRIIAEGFRRHSHKEFARFLEYCEGSTGELRSLLNEAQKKGHVTARELQPARNILYRLERGLRAFIRYLRRNPPPPWWE